ncbi:MAG: hypothetical protein M3Z09_05160 [Acidobacteriota bacterium]|nr:hypothetical protein [Acidobacteriota bacterium]
MLPEATPGAKEPAVYIEEGRYRLALSELAGDDAHTFYLRSKALAGLGELEEALRAAEKALELEPQRSEYHVQVAAACGRLAAKASMFKQLGLAKRAKKELDTGLELNPENVDALYGLMMFYYAAPSFVGGDKTKAHVEAEAMTRIASARGYLAQAQLAREAKDTAAEESFYRKSVEADPKFYEARAALAEFLDSRDRAAAEREACEAVNLDPERAQAWNILIRAAVDDQCWDEMFNFIARAKAAVPESHEAEYAAGVELIRLGIHYRWAERFLETYEGPNLAIAEAKLAEAKGRIAAAVASH